MSPAHLSTTPSFAGLAVKKGHTSSNFQSASLEGAEIREGCSEKDVSDRTNEKWSLTLENYRKKSLPHFFPQRNRGTRKYTAITEQEPRDKGSTPNSARTAESFLGGCDDRRLIHSRSWSLHTGSQHLSLLLASAPLS